MHPGKEGHWLDEADQLRPPVSPSRVITKGKEKREEKPGNLELGPGVSSGGKKLVQQKQISLSPNNPLHLGHNSGLKNSLRTGGSFKSGAVIFKPPFKHQKTRSKIVTGGPSHSSTIGESRREQASISTLLGLHLSNLSSSFNLKDSDCSLVVQGGEVVDLHLAVLYSAWPRVRELVSNSALLCHCGRTYIDLPWAESSTVERFRQLLYSGYCEPVNTSEMVKLRSFLQDIGANVNLEVSVIGLKVDQNSNIYVGPVYDDNDHINSPPFINAVGVTIFEAKQSDVTLEQPLKLHCSKFCFSECQKSVGAWSETEKLKLRDMFSGKNYVEIKNKLISHLNTQANIGIPSDKFQVNNLKFCNEFFAYMTDISVYIVKTVLKNYSQGQFLYEYGSHGVVKGHLSTTQFIVWLKEFAESYGQFSPEENKVIINYWLKKNILYKMYLDETQSPHLAESTFYNHFDTYFGPSRVDKTLPCIRKEAIKIN